MPCPRLVPSPKAPDLPGGGFTLDVIGVCHLYPGSGCWAAIFASGAKISGGGSTTTSDQMHILAAARALDATPVGAIVGIQTGSNSCCKCCAAQTRAVAMPIYGGLSIKPVRCAR